MIKTDISKRALMELVDHEAIVLEWYRDSEGIGTWGIGVTNASGHNVDRYKDKPTDVKKVLEIFKWLVETKYLPDIVDAFHGRTLSENQLAAALSFHYNTGAIHKASWVKSFMLNDMAKAREQFMLYNKPSSIIPRRGKEQKLFFDGVWSATGKATVYPVKKPSYTPDWGKAYKVDIMNLL